MTRTVPFLTLGPGPEVHAVRDAIERVLQRGWYILGPELEAFEDEFAAASGSRYAVGVGNGTDALALLLRAVGIQPGDEVITTAFSAAFTALGIMMAGATPVFVDVDEDRLTIDPDAVAAAITPRTAAILPVHLYGQPADLARLVPIAERHGLALVEDACQAHLATCSGQPVGSFGAGAAFSFYPTKNLGGVGDGGAIATNDPSLADSIRRLRNGGQAERYQHVEFGVNSRLDEIQAAVLRTKLQMLPRQTAQRRTLAAQYRTALSHPAVRVPGEHDPGHVYHLFPVRTAARDALMAHLRASGIGTLVHYPFAIPDQRAFAHFAATAYPHAAQAAREVVSLPLHPGLTSSDVDAVLVAIATWAGPAGDSVR